MARAARIALDITLISLKAVRPAITKGWDTVKTLVINSPAKPLVANPVVIKIESKLDKITDIVVNKITSLRNGQLPGEQKYLEAELEKVKKKLGGQHDIEQEDKEEERRQNTVTSRSLKSTLGTSWQYAKVECVPPMTSNFFNGPAGKNLEDTVSGITNKIIAVIAGQIKQMDDAEAKKIADKEAAIKAEQDKVKAAEAEKRKKAQLKVKEAKEKEAKSQKAADSKKVEEKKAAKAKAEPEKKKKKQK